MEICRKFGAEHVIDYVAMPKWEQEVLRLTGGHGADVVVDPVDLINQSLRCAAWDSRLVSISFAKGEIESIRTNKVLLKKGLV